MSQVTNKFLKVMATDTIKGNATGGTANPQDLTGAQVNTILPIFTSSLNGLAPSSGGGTVNYLRADGTWAAPTGTGTVSSVALADGSTSPIYSISGSPVTSSGTLTFTLNTQAANTVHAGPTTGAGAQPTFRALVTADFGTNTVTNSNLAQMATLTIKGNNTGGTANAIDLTVAQTLSMLGIRSGSASLSSATTTKAITFGATLGTTNYAISAIMVNTTDSTPQFQPITITAQSATGFTATWNAPTATANYVLHYHAIINN